MTRRLVRSGKWQKKPMRVIDGGARHGVEGHWSVYARQLEVFAFEPDAEECRRTLEADRAGSEHKLSCAAVALGARKGVQTLNVARYPDSSSLLLNNSKCLERFAMAESLEQVSTISVETTDVDAFMHESSLDYVDFMKLDVEGSELEVLRGARALLEGSLLGVSVEVWFEQEHVDRPLFGEIHTLLREYDFLLFDLRELNRWKRRSFVSENRSSWTGSGQLMYANALFLRDFPQILRDSAQPTPTVGSVLKLASLAELFCYQDFALELIDSAAEAGVLSGADADPLRADLRDQSVVLDQSGWKPAVRRAVRSAIPPRARRRLMQTLLTLAEE